MEEGRKRVLAIVAGILVARHLKTADDLVRQQAESADGINGCRGCAVGGQDYAED